MMRVVSLVAIGLKTFEKCFDQKVFGRKVFSTVFTIRMLLVASILHSLPT